MVANQLPTELLGYRRWAGEWACREDGRRAMGLKAGRIEMAGTLSELGAKLGCPRAQGKLKPDEGLQCRGGLCGGKW